MPINSFLYPAPSTPTFAFNVSNSLRFNDDDTAYMTSPTRGTATSQKKGTFSFWMKLSEIGQVRMLGTYENGNNEFQVKLTNDSQLEIYQIAGGSNNLSKKTNRVFRDPSAWMHIVIAIDCTLTAGSEDVVKVYVNGTRETSFATNTNNMPLNHSFHGFYQGLTQRIGADAGSTSHTYDGYFAEFVYIDGQQLDADSFGEFDSDSPNIWKPIDVSGLTFGNNGYYLQFKQSGTSQNSSGLGADTSGNDNHFAVTNLAATDQTTDTCTNNFITLNPIITNTNRTDNQTYSEGNTIVIPDSHDNYATASSTIGLKGSGKWYWESQIVWNGTSSNAYYPRTIGFVSEDYPYSASYMGQADESWAIIYQASGGPGWRFGHDGSESDISGATSMANGDTMIFALDLDNGKFYAGRNGTWFTSGDPTSGSTGTGALATLSANDLSKFLFPACTNASNATYYKWNFGNPAYSISSSNSDGNGYGNFEYSVPSGYYAINTKNFAEFG